MKRVSPVLILLAIAPAAFGQTIYRSIMPDGRTVLSDHPTPGARKVEQLYVPPSSPSDGAPSTTQPAAPDRAAGDAEPAVQHRDAELDAALADLRSAEAALRATEAARDAGQEPLENERQGMSGGGSRLNERYFERQKTLSDAVDLARSRVDAAQAKVNSLR
jgi:hypothetical protein